MISQILLEGKGGVLELGVRQEKENTDCFCDHAIFFTFSLLLIGYARAARVGSDF